MKQLLTFFLVASLFFFTFCSVPERDNPNDPDGINYIGVNIGGQVWMSKNLNINVSGSRCYDDNEANCNIYGRLYDWETAVSICPYGWHLPSMAEFDALENYIISEKGSCNDGFRCGLSYYLKATSGWNSYYSYLTSDSTGNGTNSYGFSALPSGYYSDGRFLTIGDYAYWWSADEYNSNTAYSWGLSQDNRGHIGKNYYKYDLLSVRCLKD